MVYCAEAVDNPGGRSQDVTRRRAFQVEHRPDLLGGATVLTTGTGDEQWTLIPYHLWAHRALGEMAVWLRRDV